MERLRGIDAALLYMETDTTHMHTLKIALFDPEPDAGEPDAGEPDAGEPEAGEPGEVERGASTGVDLEEVKRRMAALLPRLPGFRRRVVEVPWGIHHPVWIEDPNFDIDRHVRSLAVAAPGGRCEMDAAISEIAGRPLERDRPLWELWILEGLEARRIGAVVKIHHAMADGMAAAQLMAHAMSQAHEAGAPREDAWSPEAIPSPGRLVRDALVERLRLLVHLPSLIRRTFGALHAVARRLRGLNRRPPRPLLDTPRSPFNTSLTAGRTFASADFSLDDVRLVKRTFGVTVNDVLLSLVAGSLRAYLAARHLLPMRPLVSEVPVSTDRGGNANRLSGNRTSNLFVFLRTDLSDPVERLVATHAETVSAKEVHELMGAEMYEEWSDHAPPSLTRWGIRQYAKSHLADRSRSPVNLIVSSVPGPKSPLAWDGLPMRSLYSVGPILEGIGLNITLWSYVDRVSAGVLACSDRVAGLREISEGLGEELGYLVRAARALPGDRPASSLAVAREAVA